MILKKIKLLNYRNYSNISINFNKNINIFVGSNAQGKTNILESIYVLALTKSPRLSSDLNAIKFGEEFSRIIGTVHQDGFNNELEVFINKTDKKVFKNKTRIKKISNYISNLNVILFTPDDLEIIKGSPSIRRNLLNIEISQLSNDYINNYNEFNKLLKNRNEYLKILYSNGYADERYFEILTEKLIEKGTLIYIQRNEFIEKINKYLGDIYYQISGQKGLYLKYENQFEFEDYSKKNISEVYKEKLNKSLFKEKIQGMTLYGPHRDEFSFYLGDISLKLYGSQGQQRLAIISLKIAEIYLFRELKGENPVLLLDDIFSEIDKSKKNKLVKFIDDNIQTIITTTDLRGLNKSLLKNSKIFYVKEGTVEEKKQNGTSRNKV